MIWQKRTVTALGLALAFGVSACDKGLTDVNINPNAPSSATPALLFSTGSISALRNVRSGMDLPPQGIAFWSQYYAEYQYPEISYYQFRPTTADGWWSNWYAGTLPDLTQALKGTIAANRPDQTGPVLVVRAFALLTMTNIWGDIPFTEALKAEEKNFTPAYDKQSVIYDTVFANLTAANTMMTSGTSFGSQDPVYGGDLAAWKKFANSLHARAGLYLTKIAPAKAQSEVAAAIAAGGFTSNADNAAIQWPGDGVNNNPWWDNQAPPAGQGTRDDARSGATLIDTLKALNDPRLPIWFRPVQDPTCGAVPLCTPVAAGGYRGQPIGLEASAAGQWGTRASRIALNVTAADQPSYYMTYAEFSFIKAEAAARGWCTTGCSNASAAQYYYDGIRASMQQWGVADADITAYLAQPSVLFPAAAGTFPTLLAAQLHAIGVQKWLSFFTQGVEAWFMWRRLGYPNLTIALNARTTAIPRRVIYPSTEVSFNNANLQAAITSQGGSDALEKKLWIDP